MKITLGFLLPCVLSMVICTNVQLQNGPSIKPKADLILTHANVYTGLAGNSSFHEVERVQAVAITGERITAIGKADDVLKLKGPKTQVIDLGGHFVMPGFNDAHLHLAEAGFEKLNVNLIGSGRSRNSASAFAPRSKRPFPENGSSEAAGMKRFGQSRRRQPAGMWTKLPGTTQYSCRGSMDILGWRTPGPCSSPASRLQAAIPKAAKSIGMRRDSPRESCGRPHGMPCSRSCPGPHTKSGARQSRRLWPI